MNVNEYKTICERFSEITKRLDKIEAALPKCNCFEKDKEFRKTDFRSASFKCPIHGEISWFSYVGVLNGL